MSYATITVAGAELKIEYNYTPPERGTRDKYGLPLEPDFPEEIEIISVYTEDDISDLLSVANPLEVIGEHLLAEIKERQSEAEVERRLDED